MNNCQEIIEQHKNNPIEMLEKLWECIRPQGREILDQPVEYIFYHGTRRKETSEEIKQNGICTLTRTEVDKALDDAAEQCKIGIKAGPRVCKWINERKESLKTTYSGRSWEFDEGQIEAIEDSVQRGYMTREAADKEISEIVRGEHPSQYTARPNLWATIFDDACCSWSFRNPEIIHDVMYWNTPTKLMDQILEELFGTPKCIKIKLNVTIRDLIGAPQNFNTNKKCFKPEEILEVKECSKQDIIEAYQGKMPKYKGG